MGHDNSKSGLTVFLNRMLQIIFRVKPLQFRYALELYFCMLLDCYRAVFNKLNQSLAEGSRQCLRKILRNKVILVDSFYFIVPNYRDFTCVISERLVHRFILKAIENGLVEIFCDIGAHIGSYTVRYAKFVRTIIAFEPNPLALTYLKRNLVMNGLNNVKLYPIALSDSIGKLKLYLHEELGWSTILRGKRKRGCLEVKTVKLDSILQELDSDRILIKIDVEGAEPEVLMGSINILSVKRPIIICEILLENLARIKGILHKQNYLMIQIEDLNYLLVPKERLGQILNMLQEIIS